jgi:hypothetical protein
MKTRVLRLFGSALLASSVGSVVVASPALADIWINTAQGSADLTNVGVIFGYEHENVPAGTTLSIETYNLANSPATASHVDTVIHVFDRLTRQVVASNDDCTGYASCITVPSSGSARSYVIYVHAYNSSTHGLAQLKISHNSNIVVETAPFSFGGVRAYTNASMPTDAYLFTTGYSDPPLGTRLLSLQWTASVLKMDDNDGATGFSDMHLPSTLQSGGSFVVGAHGGLLYGGPADTAGVTLHWNSNVNYMMPAQKKIEDAAYEILRAAAQEPDGRWFTAFEQALGGRIDWDEANDIRWLILSGQRYPVALELVSPSVLNSSQGQALGAYGNSKIFLSTALTNEYLAANIFIEEIAHYFDQVIGGAGDALGDEGHIFWSYIIGEYPTPAELADLRSINDSGTICVASQCHNVEFIGWPRFVKKFFGTIWSGIKTTGGWVWSGATTVTNALQTAASTAWNGRDMLQSWIAKGANVAAEVTVDHLKRQGSAYITRIRNNVDTIRDLGLGVYDGAKIMAEGVADIARGEFEDGLAGLMVGLAKLSMEAPLGALTANALTEISALQTALHLEPLGRPYTPDERMTIDYVFLWNNWSSSVVIKEGTLNGIWNFPPLTGKPFTTRNIINLADRPNESGYSPDEYRVLLVHESVHVWQWANGGSDYIMSSLLYRGGAILGGPNAYAWWSWIPGTLWPSLGAEAQAAFVEDAWAQACYDFGACSMYVPPPTNAYVDHTAYFQQQADFHIINGLGAP